MNEQTTTGTVASERLLTIQNVCDRLQISPVTGWRLYSERGLKIIRVGRAVRVREADLQVWLEKNSSGGSGQKTTTLGGAA